MIRARHIEREQIGLSHLAPEVRQMLEPKPIKQPSNNLAALPLLAFLPAFWRWRRTR